jgi:hypothetical protein
MNWTQPMCENCWCTTRIGRTATRIKPEYREVERCAWCGRVNEDGIYVRADPRQLPYAKQED